MFLHDPWNNNTPDQLKEKFTKAGVYAAGVSDPGNALAFHEIDKVFPEAKWVVVTRTPRDVVKSCQTIKFFPVTDFTKHLQTVMSQKKVLRIPFEELFDRADEIGRFIYPDWECPTWRKQELKKLNVQLHWGRVSDQFRVP